MTGADVKAIREALGRMLGRHLSQQELGVALRLAPANAALSVRRWEDKGPTGPAAVALTFMREATDLSTTPNTLFREEIEHMARDLFLPQAMR